MESVSRRFRWSKLREFMQAFGLTCVVSTMLLLPLAVLFVDSTSEDPSFGMLVVLLLAGTSTLSFCIFLGTALVYFVVHVLFAGDRDRPHIA